MPFFAPSFLSSYSLIEKRPVSVEERYVHIYVLASITAFGLMWFGLLLNALMMSYGLGFIGLCFMLRYMVVFTIQTKRYRQSMATFLVNMLLIMIAAIFGPAYLVAMNCH